MLNRRAVLVGLAALMVVSAGCSSSKKAEVKAPASSAVASTTTAAGSSGDSSTKSAIPQSAAIDDLTSDLTNAKAFPLVAKCNQVVTVVLANTVGLENDPDVKAALDGLVNLVRPIDPAVADALAKDADAASEWCKATGMAN